MEQFVVVALAHFLALLIPGMDFFLIARTALASGWRRASGTCAGIAVANGLFIAAAFSGMSLITHPVVLTVIQLAGGAFLIYLGIVFLRAKISVEVTSPVRGGRGSWFANVGLGLASGLLNPKNALFYVSLAAALTRADPLELVGYGVWMVSIVFAWDLFVAVALGSQRTLTRLSAVLPRLGKLTGGFLVLFGLAMIITVVVDQVR